MTGRRAEIRGHGYASTLEVSIPAAKRRMTLDDETVELKEWDALRVSVRGKDTRPERTAPRFIVIGAPNLREAPREDVEGQRDGG
jgi:hypothetical protein